MHKSLQYFKAKYQVLNYLGNPLNLGILVLFHLNIRNYSDDNLKQDIIIKKKVIVVPSKQPKPSHLRMWTYKNEHFKEK